MWGRDHLAQACSVRNACALPPAGCGLRGKRKVSTSDSGRADPAQVRRGAPAACGYVPATRSAPRSKSKRTMKRTPPGPGAPGRAVLAAPLRAGLSCRRPPLCAVVYSAGPGDCSCRT